MTTTLGAARLRRQPNNGMHPTCDTAAVKFLQWLGRAVDAGRYTASRLFLKFLPQNQRLRC